MSSFGRVLCIITGASKGFGRAIATDMARHVKPKSMFILVARSEDELRNLQSDLARSGMEARSVVLDLSRKGSPEMVVRIAKDACPPDIEHVILFNNAGTLGDVSRLTRTFTSMAEVDSYLSFNVSSAFCLTAGVLQAFPRSSGVRRCVVNVSSLCALKPFPTWGLYCTGKAARDMMFKVLAEEEPDVRVLNYAPGPLNTDMQETIRTKTGDPQLRQQFLDMFEEGELLSVERSCAKLMKLLKEDKYKSGEHIDYYDV
ncbi:sepiapterin reductase a [Corythoichthys intestinalis]|uniref:sepiapterin reductase a n=1 Tax=Corythoichthys intestinalis TaxID=161448 RepID=UPI0025A5A642|nr:sepiapterin reductase a [Corythoichthys intestinalis]XP_061800781.1 sepiapterin reductase-like [Nerophis lumbriciformis]